MTKKSTNPREGRLYRESGVWWVEVTGETGARDVPSVHCVNPHMPPAEQIWQKPFFRKKIFGPDSYDAAVAAHLYVGPRTFVLSMNGYSRLGAELCARYGVDAGTYEATCAAALSSAIHCLREDCPQAELRLVDGASGLGVDGAIATVSRERGVPRLGFSCPRFMLYVEDDDQPVFVAESTDGYAKHFVRSLDLLICTGGRIQTLLHDIDAALHHRTRLHVVDVMGALSEMAGRRPLPERDGALENAAATLSRNLSLFTPGRAHLEPTPPSHRVAEVVASVVNAAVAACEAKMFAAASAGL